MQWTNNERGYGWLSIALHWIAAAIIIMMLLTGFRAEQLGEAGDRAGRAAAMGWHISIGGALAVILLIRVISSYVQKRPAPIEQPRPLMLLAGATHHLLLIGILLQIVSGPLAVWSGGRAINIFDLFSLPSPFAERNDGAHELAETLHAIGRWIIIIFGSLHVLAVIRHAFGKTGVMRRMLAPPASN